MYDFRYDRMKPELRIARENLLQRPRPMLTSTLSFYGSMGGYDEVYISLMVLAASFVPEAAVAQAWTCYPRDFTFEEPTKIDFSDLARFSKHEE